jgi:hypothetical protein
MRGVRLYIGAIAAAHRKNKSKSTKKSEEKVKLDPDGMTPYTQEWKDKHLKWVEDGLCGSCGSPSGEEKGICDECRWS